MNYYDTLAAAKQNAEETGEVWCNFCDTSGRWRSERYRGQNLSSWSGCQLDLVYPSDLKIRFIPRANNEIEGWDILDLLTTCGTEEKEPTVPLTVWDESYVQTIVDVLNKGYATWKLVNKEPKTREPGE